MLNHNVFSVLLFIILGFLFVYRLWVEIENHTKATMIIYWMKTRTIESLYSFSTESEFKVGISNWPIEFNFIFQYIGRNLFWEEILYAKRLKIKYWKQKKIQKAKTSAVALNVVRSIKVTNDLHPVQQLHKLFSNSVLRYRSEPTNSMVASFAF